MEAILLINYDDIFHYTSNSGNIDVAKINPHIQNAQILYLEHAKQYHNPWFF